MATFLILEKIKPIVKNENQSKWQLKIKTNLLLTGSWFFDSSTVSWSKFSIENEYNWKHIEPNWKIVNYQEQLDREEREHRRRSPVSFAGEGGCWWLLFIEEREGRRRSPVSFAGGGGCWCWLFVSPGEDGCWWWLFLMFVCLQDWGRRNEKEKEVREIWGVLWWFDCTDSTFQFKRWFFTTQNALIIVPAWSILMF